jgi:excinuclease ABC subunit A
MRQLNGLVASGNTVIVVEHNMDVIAGSDRIIDIGPGAGDEAAGSLLPEIPNKLPAYRPAGRPCTSRFARHFTHVLA